MKAAAWMAAASLGSWLAASTVLDASASRAVLAGMLAPLAGALISWLLAERAYLRTPEKLTARMTIAFAGKVLFFGIYVIAVLRGTAVQPIPFAVSFTGYFIALYLGEALLLRRLFAGRTGDADSHHNPRRESSRW